MRNVRSSRIDIVCTRTSTSDRKLPTVHERARTRVRLISAPRGERGGERAERVGARAGKKRRRHGPLVVPLGRRREVDKVRSWVYGIQRRQLGDDTHAGGETELRRGSAHGREQHGRREGLLQAQRQSECRVLGAEAAVQGGFRQFPIDPIAGGRSQQNHWLCDSPLTFHSQRPSNSVCANTK